MRRQELADCQTMMLPLTTLFVLVLLAAGTAAVCQKTCTSDAQCKGFTQVSDLRYCVQGCCSTYNTAVAVLNANVSSCLGDIEAYTNSDANQYPWFAMLTRTTLDDGCYCIGFGVLIAPGWLLGEGCSAPSTANTTVYFYLDDPRNRQVYSAEWQSTLSGAVEVYSIEYIGSGTPLTITPVPLNCNQAYLSSGTSMAWSLDDASKTRTFVTSEHDFHSQTQCTNEIASGCPDSSLPSMYCFDDQSPFLSRGSPLFAPGGAGAGAGAFQLIGRVSFNPCYETDSVAYRIVTFSTEIQQITGATCAS